MNTKEQQVKNIFVYILPQAVTTLLPLITLPIFTRILTKEDYGILALVYIYAILLNSMAHLGLVNIYNRNFFQYQHDKQKTSQLLYSIMTFIIALFLFLAGITYLLKGPLAKLITGSSQYANILFCAVFAQFFTSIKEYYSCYFINTAKATSFVVYTIAASLINVVVALFLVAYLRIGVIGLLYAQLFSSLIIFGALSYKFLNMLPFSFNKNILIEALKTSYPLVPRSFIKVIHTQFDKYMIGLLASIGGVGVYSIGHRASGLIFSFTTSLQNVFQPQVYKRMFDLKEKGGESIGKYLTPFAYASIFAALVTALFSHEVIVILTPPSYHGAINIVTILCMYYGFMFFGKQPQLTFMKKTGVVSLLTFVSMSMNIGLNIPFIIHWGAIGAAWATFISGLISGLISFAVAQHYFRIKWEYRKLGAIFLIFFTSSILIIILRNVFVAYPVRLIIKLIFLACYVYVGVKAEVITRKNYILVKNVILFKRFVPFNEKQQAALR